MNEYQKAITRIIELEDTAAELLEAAEYAIEELGQIAGLIPLIAAVGKAKGE